MTSDPPPPIIFITPLLCRYTLGGTQNLFIDVKWYRGMNSLNFTSFSFPLTTYLSPTPDSSQIPTTSLLGGCLRGGGNTLCLRCVADWQLIKLSQPSWDWQGWNTYAWLATLVCSWTLRNGYFGFVIYRRSNSVGCFKITMDFKSLNTL